MARTRMTIEEVAKSQDVDRTIVDATTEEDIQRHMIEDGEDPGAPATSSRTVLPVAAVRARVGMSQAQFAKALGIPAATLRNWE